MCWSHAYLGSSVTELGSMQNKGHQGQLELSLSAQSKCCGCFDYPNTRSNSVHCPPKAEKVFENQTASKLACYDVLLCVTWPPMV